MHMDVCTRNKLRQIVLTKKSAFPFRTDAGDNLGLDHQ